MATLAFDTTMQACSCALREGGEIRARIYEPLARGHAERIAPMIAEVLAQAETGFDAIDRIGVTVGPGSFTGVRVGVAMARGLALRAGARPGLAGVSTLAALAQGADDIQRPELAAVVVDARRGEVYMQIFGRAPGAGIVSPIAGPAACAPDEAARRCAAEADAAPLALIGSGAGLVAPELARLGAAFRHAAADAQPDAADVAALADAAAPAATVSPLYLRPPDAKLPGGVHV